jgi:hypothetical protein
MGLPVRAHVGDGIEPDLCSGVMSSGNSFIPDAFHEGRVLLAGFLMIVVRPLRIAC